ncbi:hypothetical protein ES703_56500 [subsurface metagenome]
MHRRRRRSYQKGRKKNVDISLDLLSLYTIISSMKGRNCYACFWSSPGFEKLLTILEVKASFLRPVSLPQFQREPFRLRAAAGFGTEFQHHVSSKLPAAGFFSVLYFITRGRFGLLRSPPQPTLRIDHCFLLCLTFFTVWLCPFARFAQVNTLAGQPFFWSTS